MARAFHSKVAGVTAKNDDGRQRQHYIRTYCRAGMPLRLVREPSNQFDKNAIGAWITARAFIFFTSEVQIGYIGADVAAELAPHMDRGESVTAAISEVTGGIGHKKNLGVNIVVTRG